MQNSDFSSQVKDNRSLDRDHPSFDLEVREQGELASPSPQQEQKLSWLWHFYRLNSLSFLTLGIFCICAIALPWWGWYRWQYARSFEVTNNAYIVSDIAGVNVRVPGKVARIFIPKDQKVKRGNVLIQLYPQQYQRQLNQAQANLQQAQVDLQSARQNLKSAPALLDKSAKVGSIGSSKHKSILQTRIISEQLRKRISNLDAIFVRSELDYNRFARLQQKGFISLNTLTKTKAYYERLQGERKKVIEKWQQAQDKFLQAKLKVLEGQIEGLETQRENQPTPTFENSNSSQQINTDQNQFERKKQNLTKQIKQITDRKELIKQSHKNQQRIYKYELSKLKLKVAQEIFDNLQTQVKAAKYQLASTKIVAPSNGKIGLTQVEVGQKVKAGQTLISLIPNSRWVVAHFQPQQLANIKNGQSVQIQIKNLSETTFTGKVKKIPNNIPKTERSQNQNYIYSPVKIYFDPPISKPENAPFIPGTPVDIKVKVRE